jgi:hypothetical protein
MNKQLLLSFLPGTIFKVRHNGYTHYVVKSDRIGVDGMPMFIDNSAARGTVAERNYYEAVCGGAVTMSCLESEFSEKQILEHARGFIGQVNYSLFSFNCESFVRKILGLSPTSKQVVVPLITVPSTVYIAHKVSGGNKWVMGLAGIAALVITTRAVAE